MTTLRIGAALLAAMFTFAPAALAGENGDFGAEPYPATHDGAVRRSFDIPEGRTFTDAFRVYNRTRGAVDLTIYAAEASVGDDGVVAIGFRGVRRRGLAGRITVGRASLHLAVGADAIVPFEVRMRGAPRDGLAALVIEGAPAAGEAVDLVQRIAMLVRPAADSVGNGARISRETGPGHLRLASLLLLLIVGGWLVDTRRRTQRAGRIDAEAAVGREI